MEQQVTYLTLKEHRNQKRLWLEGLRLKNIGFVKGATYKTEYNQEQAKITLTLGPAGEKIVSGRKRKGQTEYTPIIDIVNNKIGATVKDAPRVRIVFSHEKIIITAHHEDVEQADRENRIKAHAQAGELTQGVLCVGGGIASAALSEGLEVGGLSSTVEWIADIEGKYLQSAIDNNAHITDDTTIFHASLEEIEADLLCPVDVLQVSLPCTGHSKAGKSKNQITNAEQHSTDATAVIGFLNARKASNPAVIVSENVPEAQNSATYQLIMAELSRLGYTIYQKIMDHTDAGTLERRRRWWFVAVSSGLNLFDFAAAKPLQQIYKTLGEALEPVSDDSTMWADNNYLKEKAITDKAAGKGFARQLLTGAAESVGCVGRHYAKRRSTEPFIVKANGQERLLTPIEHARVKGIPESLIANVPMTTAHQILGQSVLWGHARLIGEALAASLTPRQLSLVA